MDAPESSSPTSDLVACFGGEVLRSSKPADVDLLALSHRCAGERRRQEPRCKGGRDGVAEKEEVLIVRWWRWALGCDPCARNGG